MSHQLAEETTTLSHGPAADADEASDAEPGHESEFRHGAESSGSHRHSGAVIIFEHSSLMYWWPVWAAGFVMAILTAWFGNPVSVAGQEELFLGSVAPGTIWLTIAFFVLLSTNVVVRGIAAVAVILVGLLGVTTIALLGWWDALASMLPYVSVRMNYGFFLFASSGLFITWAIVVFGYDRLTYWRVSPGQVTRKRVIGGGEKSFDTIGMSFEERLADPFRHYVLGFGTGDLEVTVRNPQLNQFQIRNVAFARRKVLRVQEMIRRKPD